MVSFGEKAKIKKAGNLNSGRSYVITTVQWDLLFLIYVLSFFFCTCLFTKHFVLLQKQQEPKQVYSTCQQYVIDFLSSLWLIVFTCLRDVFLRYIFAFLKYTVDLVHSAIPC